jgi:hypothetical protein
MMRYSFSQKQSTASGKEATDASDGAMKNGWNGRMRLAGR